MAKNLSIFLKCRKINKKYHFDALAKIKEIVNLNIQL